jgi:hypothetical protein
MENNQANRGGENCQTKKMVRQTAASAAIRQVSSSRLIIADMRGQSSVSSRSCLRPVLVKE